MGPDQMASLEDQNLLCYSKLPWFSRLTLYLTETPYNTFANRTDPDKAALVRAA